MPSAMLGAETIVVSGSGIEGDRSGRAEVAFLDALGAPDDAYLWAVASQLGEGEAFVQAFQVCGAPQDEVLDAFIGAFRASTIETNLMPPVIASTGIIDGIGIVSFTGKQGVVYLYAESDTVFAIWAPDAQIATSIIQEWQ